MIRPAAPRDVASSGAEFAGGTRSIGQRLSNRLRGLIEGGEIAAGQRLLEVKVAEAFGVSRSPARAALVQLADEGLLQKSAGRGYTVAGLAMAGAGVAQLPEGTVIDSSPSWALIYDDVEQALASQVLFATVRVTEERLAEHFGVSRTVARDVLVRMQGVGLVDKDRYGRWIAHRVTSSRIRDLYEMRWLLEPQALLQSAPRLDPARVVQMRDRLGATLSDLGRADSPTLDRLERDLHFDLLDGCRNREIPRALAATRVLLVSNRYVFDLYLGIPVAVIAGSLGEHLRVLNAVLDRDWEAAAAALEAHLRASCDHWLGRLARIEPMERPRLPPFLTLDPEHDFSGA